MAYTKVFDNPYPGGWQDNPSVMTPITAAALQEHTDAIEHIEDYLANGGGGGGTGSSVSWNQIKKSGEKIATITIDGTPTDVYAATQGGGGGSDVAWNQKITSGTNIATVTINGVSTEVYAPTSGGGSGAAWGQITGTLSDQTDLQTALNGKLTTKNLGNALYNLTFDTAAVADGTKILSGGSGGTYSNRSALSLYNYIKSKLDSDGIKNIEWNQKTTSGTNIATITIGGVSTEVYAETGGSTLYYEETMQLSTVDDNIFHVNKTGGFGDSVIDIYTNIFGYNPKEVFEHSNGMNIIFPPYSENVNCTLRVYIK